MKKFWNWKNQTNPETNQEERVLELNGVIASESWFDDEVSPKMFKDELNDRKVIVDVKGIRNKNELKAQGYRYWRL